MEPRASTKRILNQAEVPPPPAGFSVSFGPAIPEKQLSGEDEKKGRSMNRLIQFKSSRWAAMLLATVVTIITSAVVANATQTITTPNAAFISYNLTVGASSAAITPVTNKSVLVMGCCTVSGAQGVGQVSLLHLPSGGFVWVGLEPYPSGITTKGLSGT